MLPQKPFACATRIVGLSEPIPGVTYIGPDGQTTYLPSNFDSLMIEVFSDAGNATLSVFLRSSVPTPTPGSVLPIFETLEIYAYADHPSSSMGITVIKRETWHDGSLAEADDEDPHLGNYPATILGMNDFDNDLGLALKAHVDSCQLYPQPTFEGRAEDI